MFIAIVGTRCAGKSTVEDYLISKGFVAVRLSTKTLGANQEPRLDGQAKETTGLCSTRCSTPSTVVFTTPNELLEYVTRHWRSNFVTVDLISLELINPFIKRPFFLLIKVDAPLLQRYHRHSLDPTPLSLEEFVRQDDDCVFGMTGLHAILPFVKVNVLNTFQTVPELRSHLDFVNVLSTERLRPRWDSYFMTLADLASQRSNCMKRRVGAILVRDNRIVATGYNGTPRGVKNCNEGGCAHCNGVSIANGTDCLCLHAEENALLEAGRDRVGSNAILYCNTCPCLKCTIKIIQSGVKEVVYHLSYKVDEESARLFQEAGVHIRRHFPTTIV
ncbi:cytidine deaminase-like protein [Pisolithus croceorrhizus]|nr:cytidine deaminase-like protein [Pisolithus croceorrhizus]